MTGKSVTRTGLTLCRGGLRRQDTLSRKFPSDWHQLQSGRNPVDDPPKSSARPNCKKNLKVSRRIRKTVLVWK